MFDLNAASIEAHPDTNDNAQHPTPVRLRCTCGECPECGSTSVLPLIASPTDGEVNPTAGASGEAYAREQEEHQHANHRGSSTIEIGVAPTGAPAATLAPTSLARAQGVTGRVSGDPGDRALRSISHATMTAAVTKFESIAGQMPLGHATPEDVTAFVGGLRREGKSESTVLRYLRAMKAVTQLLGAFEQPGTGHSNPFAQAAELLCPPALSIEPAPPFALKQLQKLLSSPRYIAMKNAAEPHRAARFWVPLLCLFTYARPKEVMRLQVSELERHEDAWVLRVSSTMQLDPRTGAPVMRRVPLHEELVRCGFVSYVAQRKLGGHAEMFGTGSEEETLSASASRVSYWFSGLGQTLGLGEGCSVQAIRKAFIAACFRSGITDEGIRLLAGRTVAVPSTLRPLPSSLSEVDALDQAIAWVRRLRFEGLEVSHLHATDPLACVSEAYPDSTAP